jgi:hypothetical protein
MWQTRISKLQAFVWTRATEHGREMKRGSGCFAQMKSAENQLVSSNTIPQQWVMEYLLMHVSQPATDSNQ